MVKKLLLAVGFLPTTFVILVLLLSGLYKTQRNEVNTAYAKQLAIERAYSDVYQISPHLISAAGSAQVLGVQIVAGDAREMLLHDFLVKHDSPMAPYAGTIVQEADKHEIDFKLVPAIAMCESNLGKRMPSSDSYNAWGISVYTGQQSGATFRNWEHAIGWVSTYIKEKYISKGITDLKQIGSIWAPPSVLTGYSWTNCVEMFLSEIQLAS